MTVLTIQPDETLLWNITLTFGTLLSFHYPKVMQTKLCFAIISHGSKHWYSHHMVADTLTNLLLHCAAVYPRLSALTHTLHIYTNLWRILLEGYTRAIHVIN